MNRIFMIGWEYPPHITGGLGVACQGLIKALSARGDQVLFLLPRLYGDEPQYPGTELADIRSTWNVLDRAEQEELRRMIPADGLDKIHFSTYDSHRYRADNLRAYTHSMQGRSLQEDDADDLEAIIQGGYGNRISEEVRTYARIAAMIAIRRDFDVIHAHDWMTFPAALEVARVSGKACILQVHATEFDRSGENINPYVYEMEKDSLHRCDGIVAVSGMTKEILVRRYGLPEEKIQVVYNGVDLSTIIAPPADGDAVKKIQDKLVLFLGRLTFQKGPDYFVRAAGLVLEQMRNVRFVMAGGGDMYHRVIELAADLGIGDHFHYTGPLNREEVRRIYGMSDLYLMPSVSEPFGIAALEAAAHGVPVIISKQSGVGEVFKGCLKVDFWDVQELASNMMTVLTNDRLAASMRKSSMKEVQKITWERAARELNSVYKGFMKMETNE